MTEIAVSHPEFMEGIAAAGGFLALDREFSLLLNCCGDQAPRRLQCSEGEPKPQFDWNKLLRLAGEHRVIPPVYLALAASPGMVPAPCLEALRFRFQTGARQSLLLSSELFRIVDHLESCGIAALAYKGPVLAHLLFDDVTGRQFGDLDLLVRESQVSRATRALAQLGYHPGLELTTREERDHLATGYECPFNGPLGRHIVELKWRVLPRFYSIDFAIDALFERAVPVELEGHSIPTLGSEDLFLVLCVHAAKHAWNQLSLLLDIAGLIRRGGLDWKLIFEQASALGIERLLEVNLLLANQLLGTTLPPRTGPQVPPAPSLRLLEQVRQILAEGEPIDTASLPYFLLMMRLRENWGDRARFLGRLLGTPSAAEWSAIHLPEALSPLYRLVRVFRLLGKLASLARV
jgi:hypothetical protein